jgi:hypothetical protein
MRLMTAGAMLQKKSDVLMISRKVDASFHRECLTFYVPINLLKSIARLKVSKTFNIFIASVKSL